MLHDTSAQIPYVSVCCPVCTSHVNFRLKWVTWPVWSAAAVHVVWLVHYVVTCSGLLSCSKSAEESTLGLWRTFNWFNGFSEGKQKALLSAAERRATGALNVRAETAHDLPVIFSTLEMSHIYSMQLLFSQMTFFLLRVYDYVPQHSFLPITFI